MILASQVVEQPAVVDRITVENPTRYDITVRVTDGEQESWMSVGTVRREDTSTFRDVLDQGEVWIFGFSAQGEEGGELRRTRGDLERAGWRFSIPAAVGEELHDKGAAFSP